VIEVGSFPGKVTPILGLPFDEGTRPHAGELRRDQGLLGVHALNLEGPPPTKKPKMPTER